MEVFDVTLVWRIACDGRYASRDDAAALLGELDVVLRHILDHPDSEVFAFAGPLMSVCGLPAFMAQEPEGISQPSHGPVETGETPWSPVEDNIRKTLSEVSGVTVSSVLKTHSIYHLGLDSISAIKVSGLLRQRDVRLAFRDMLRAKSISEMALMVEDAPSTQVPEVELKEIGQQLGGVDTADLLAKANIDVTDVEAILPATAMQVHLLSVWQNTEGAVFYPEFRFCLTGPIDVDTVLTRWSELVKETPILRTSFVATKTKEVPILQVVRQASTGNQYTRLSVHRDGDSCIVSLKIHHALYDAISLSVLLGRLLGGSSVVGWGQRVTAQEALEWKQFAAARLDASTTRARERFWTEYLGGATAQSHPARKTDDNTRVSTFYKSALPDISRLKFACSDRGLSIQSVFFAAYAKLLASSNATASTNTDNEPARDVIFGIYLANRTETASSASALTTYPTLALVPLRVHLESEQEDILDVAERVQRDLHTISDPVGVAVGLWEIQAWTGVVVDSFVNFLGVAPKRHWGEGEGGVELMEPENEEGEERPVPYSELEGLKWNLVRDAYPVSTPIFLRGVSRC